MSEFAQAMLPVLYWLDGRLVWLGLVMALPTALLTLRGRKLGILFPIAAEEALGRVLPPGAASPSKKCLHF